MAVLTVAALMCASCGYHVGGRGDLMPKNVRTIAIPAFANGTTRYRLTERLPGAITREFLMRTKYRIVADPREADAVLEGSVLNYVSYPAVYDPNAARAAVVQMIVTLQITLRGHDGQVIFSRPWYEVKQRYEVSVDPRAYFEESDVGLDRVCRDVAQSLVSAILENF